MSDACESDECESIPILAWLSSIWPSRLLSLLSLCTGRCAFVLVVLFRPWHRVDQ